MVAVACQSGPWSILSTKQYGDGHLIDPWPPHYVILSGRAPKQVSAAELALSWQPTNYLVTPNPISIILLFIHIHLIACRPYELIIVNRSFHLSLIPKTYSSLLVVEGRGAHHFRLSCTAPISLLSSASLTAGRSDLFSCFLDLSTTLRPLVIIAVQQMQTIPRLYQLLKRPIGPIEKFLFSWGTILNETVRLIIIHSLLLAL